MTAKEPFRSVKDERDYWAKADLSRAAAKAEAAGTMMVTTLYVGREHHAAMNRLAQLTHEKAAALYRRAILEFLRREARKNGTTVRALAGLKD
ncbi:MAG: hypothetical protein HY815_19110 [Candidatus Riflebacteria bacterium]|nr:hypothetical protein [Candidatus Riflebacteria bacterium]